MRQRPFWTGVLEESVSIYMLRVNIASWLPVLMIPLLASAQDQIRIGVSDSDGPPVTEVSQHKLVAGLSWEFGQLLAAELKVRPLYVVISRKRVEWSLEHGNVDIVCNANPSWYGDATQLRWTREIYPQIEKVATLNTPAVMRQLDDLAGKRVVTIHGYTYPALEPFWASGRATQLTETRMDLMMKALNSKLADAAVVSELEFAYWSRHNPDIARQIKLQPLVVSSVPTMCALSPKSAFTLGQLNQAIEHMNKTGQLKAILRRYQWSAK